MTQSTTVYCVLCTAGQNDYDDCLVADVHRRRVSDRVLSFRRAAGPKGEEEAR